MVSDHRIGSIFFPGSVCVSSTSLTPCHVPHVHVPFYEGTCQNLLKATGGTLEQLQSGITMASDYRIDLCARGHMHVPFYEGMCPKK